MTDELKTFIGEKMGEATMCWTPIPSGLFDSQRATAILQEIYDAVEVAIQPPVSPIKPVPPSPELLARIEKINAKKWWQKL